MFSWLITGLLVVGFVMLVVYLLDPQAFSRMKMSAGAEAGKIGRGWFRRTAIDIKKNMIDKKIAEVEQAELTQIEFGAHVLNLEDRKKTCAAELAKATRYATQYASEGNDEKAKKYLLEKKEISCRLVEIDAELTKAKNDEASIKADIDRCREQIEREHGNTLNQEQQLSLKRNQAKLSKMRADMDGLGSWDAQEVNDAINKEIHLADAASRVHSEKNSSKTEEYELEKRIKLSEVDNELAELKANLGKK